MTNKYARIARQTASVGTCKKLRNRSRQAKAAPVSRAAAAAVKTKDAQRFSRSPCSSRWPKRMENSAPLPMHRPSSTEVRNVISVNDEPTAASASRPSTRPTISVSAML